MATIIIKNWDHFQHYKDRRPPWIKFHVDVLQDYAFNMLASASKAHLMLLWLLASRYDNKIPADNMERLRWEIGCADLDLNPLVSHGFIIIKGIDASDLLASDSKPVHVAIVETETEEEKKTEGEQEKEALSLSSDQSSSSSTKSTANLKPAFHLFWDAWAEAGGRKVDKSRSYEAFRAAYQRSNETLPRAFADVLVTAANRQAADREELERIGKFVPEWANPKTWLRGDRWKDDIGHAVDHVKAAADKGIKELQAELEAEEDR